jgi:hypothetical protein
MTTISAVVIEDSVSQTNPLQRIRTLVLTYPRFIHSEFMTHRVFSRNASSSRAIPVKKVLEEVWNNPATPIHWGANRSGMQAKEELKGLRRAVARFIWGLASKLACLCAWCMMKIGLHKQAANRILEPFQHIRVICTATEWDNFFQLRRHPDAQPEIQELANKMYEAMEYSKPRVISEDSTGNDRWHLPFVTSRERIWLSTEDCIKASVARCARVSYLNHDKTEPSLEKDRELFERLMGCVPEHASPSEHQARLAGPEEHSGNLRGWAQYRKLHEQINNIVI